MLRRISARMLLLAAVLLARPAWAADEARAPKTGGNYEVEVHKNIPYVEGKDVDERQKLDLYLPKGIKDYPTLFFIHGGGWRGGSRSGFGRIGRTFARNGVAFVSTGYRLSPKVKHPAHIEDVAKGFAWTVANIGKYGGNPGAIFVSGHSAGGHLAALLATDDEYLKAHKLSLSNIKGVIPVSGVYVVSPRMKDIFGDDVKVCKKASPRSHVREGLPPFLIIYGDNEIAGLGKQAEAFAPALKERKVEATILKGKDRNHGTIMMRMAAEDDPATQAVLEFIARHSSLKLTGAADDKVVDPVGTWKCEYEIAGKRTSTLTIKKNGDKLVGTMSWPDQKETKLKDLKLKDGALTFSVERRFMDNTFTVEYKLTIDGDKLKGKGAAELGGEKREWDITGKREKKDK